MAKPEPFDMNYLVNLHREEFVKFELWLSDELTQHLVTKFDLDPSYTSVVVDMDENEPLASGSGGMINLRLNGRFYIPLHDKKGVELNVASEDWLEASQEWFDKNEVEADIDNSDELLKFTAFIEGISIPDDLLKEGAVEESSPEGEGEGEGGDDTALEEPMVDEGFEEEEVEDIEDEEPPPSDEEEDLKDFEKSLGL